MKKGQLLISFKNTSDWCKHAVFIGFLFSFNLIFSQSVEIIKLKNNSPASPRVITGAEQTAAYLPLIKGKKIAIVANQTSTIGTTHLVDSLFSLGIKIKKIFAPEHGFRGDAGNGDKINNSVDAKTGISIVSLYGKNIKPTKHDLKGVDVVLFDIQDVGVRFYTFLTTMHYVMEACAEHNKTFIVLDRPNPNGHYVDGPILKSEFKSMVGMHPIPLVHGMTLGELAQMIVGEKWINGQKLQLKIVPVANYTHNTAYTLPVNPSPNLPTMASILLYPSLGLFEGADVSMGRGTDKPFECFGAPWLKHGNYKFTPQNIPGKATNPPFMAQECRGVLLTDFAYDYIVSYKHIYLPWLINMYKECPQKDKFFNAFFNKLAGTDELKKQIIEGKSAEQILESWQGGLFLFLQQRKPYLIYDFDPMLGVYPKYNKN